MAHGLSTADPVASEEPGIYLRWIKPVGDRIAAALGLLILSPILAAVAVAVRATLGRPVLFKQQRPGRRERPFTLLKFRTMTEAAANAGAGLDDAQRLTGLGRFLRSWSLDELPELVNVLRGEMSIVGPRPLLVDYLPRYSPEQARRHEVRPGLTGWAQVNGRNAVDWDERLRLDVWYVDHVSPWLDLRILWLTVFRVLTRQGIAAEGHATMPAFRGAADRRGPGNDENE